LEICATAVATPDFDYQDLYDLDRRGDCDNNNEYSESEESIDTIGDDTICIKSVETIPDREESAVEIEVNSAEYADTSDSEDTDE
jgi:hypothetical protein